METSLWGDQTKRVARMVAIFLGVLSVFFIVKLGAELKGYKLIGSGTTATNTISVSGSGDAYAVPDVATVSFTVENEAKTVAEAQKTVNDKMQKALDFIKKNNVAEKDIQLTGNSFYPQYDYPQIQCFAYPCPSGKQVLRGYQVSRSIMIKIRAIDDAGKIVEGLGTIGVTNLNGPTFTLDDEDGIKAEARGKAIADAKAKAEELAKELGVHLVRIVNFSENGNSPYPYYAKADMAMGMGGGTGGEVAPELPKGENKYTSNVSVTYEIR